MSEKATLREWCMSYCLVVLLFERNFCHQAKSFANFPLYPQLFRFRFWNEGEATSDNS